MPSSSAGDPPVVISRADAKAQGLTFYFTGKQCLRGHVSLRYVRGSRCKECSDATRVAFNLKCPNYFMEWRQNNPVAGLLVGARGRAKKAGLEFRLLPTDLIIPANCPCCGRDLRPVVGKKTAGPSSPSLDRHDNNKGYTPENTVVICWRCNSVKKDCDVDELTAVLNYMKKPRLL